VSRVALSSQLVAKWLLQEHSTIGSSLVQVVEMGPGRGTMIKEIIKVSGRHTLGQDDNGCVFGLDLTQMEVFRYTYVLCPVRAEPTDETSASRNTVGTIGRALFRLDALLSSRSFSTSSIR
jgi:hypothetical protein